ncbi:glycosyltransferase family 2 protein [candidate division WOR-3 bacterium]|nr:glycosyltransferase family 2 protein [candidate division WOR-3 bacterium]
MTISLIICTKDRPIQLKGCLETVFAQTVLPNEIIIVDASNNDLTRELIEALKKETSAPILRYVHTPPSTAMQRNVGMSYVKTDIFGFIDDDIEMDVNTLKKIRDVFMDAKRKPVGGVATRIIDYMHSKRTQWSISTLYKRIFLLSHGFDTRIRILRSGFVSFPYRCKDLITILDVDTFPTTCCFFTREIAKHYRFYEGFCGYSFMEDVEFTYRVSRDHRLLYVPNAHVLHLQAPEGRSSYFALYKQVVENHHYFFTEAVRQDFINKLAFYWSHVGLLISALLKKPKWGRNGSVSGFFAGFQSILRRQRQLLSVNKTE